MSAPTVIHAPADLKDVVGTHLGWSPWKTIEQDRIDRFADATDDHQWTHIDTERAKHGPFHGTIAHGLLTLSMAPGLVFDVLEVTGASMIINYGFNKVRFPAPVPSGSKIRMGVGLTDATDVPGGVQAVLGLTFNVADQIKPGCVAELVLRYLD